MTMVAVNDAFKIDEKHSDIAWENEAKAFYF